MRLDRNKPDGRKKYALIKWRNFNAHMACPDCSNDFFVLRYSDPFAKKAFHAYVKAVDEHVRYLEHGAEDRTAIHREEIEKLLAELRPYLADLMTELMRMQSIPSAMPT